MSHVPSRIGAYEVVREIGRGGMGVVFLARDTRLERDVAIKALPPELTADPDRLARFEREGKALAQLSHGNVAGIHGVEEEQGQKFLVLEYVEGESLADRLRAGPIAVDDAVEIAAAIAAGLEAAHRVGVVHRDLKPDNVRITPRGEVKVLDFGLARAGAADESSGDADSPTMTSPRSPTIPGAILGTAAYMSPEQARGRRVDRRTDNWALGVVLYELLTGTNPFAGESVADTLGAVIHREPDWTALPDGTPPILRHLLRRCLTKDPRRRLHDIADARVELEELAADPTSGDIAPVARRAPATRAGRSALAAAVLGAFVLGLAAMYLWLGRPTDAPDAAPVEFEIDLGELGSITLPESSADIAISPDGRRIAFEYETGSANGLAVRELASTELHVVEAARGGWGPFFSPDGRWLGFWRDGKLMKAALAGGPALTICDLSVFGGRINGRIVWLDDGRIVFSDDDGIRIVDADGGTPVSVATAGRGDGADAGSEYVAGFDHVLALPDGRGLLAGVWNGNSIEDFDVVHVALDTGTITRVVERATHPGLLDDDRLVFLRDSSLVVVRFDVDRLRVVGSPEVLVEGVRTNPWGAVAQYEVGGGGMLAYVPGRRLVEERRLIRVSRDGNVEPLGEPDALAGYLDVAPDGRILTIGTHRRYEELWLYDLASGAMTPVHPGASTTEPLISPDGSRVAYRVWDKRGDESSIVVRSIDVTEEPRVVVRNARDLTPHSWSPDGEILLTSPDGLVVVNDDGTDDEPRAVLTSESSHWNPRFSPDGTWIALQSDESGTEQVYVHRYPFDRRKWQVSRGGGIRPQWSPDGDELFFIQDGYVQAVPFGVAPDGRPRIGAATTLFDAREIASIMWGVVYDVLPDGDFIMIERAPWERRDARIRVVVNEHLARDRHAP